MMAGRLLREARHHAGAMAYRSAVMKNRRGCQLTKKISVIPRVEVGARAQGWNQFPLANAEADRPSETCQVHP